MNHSPFPNYIIKVLELPETQHIAGVGVEVHEELFGPLPVDAELRDEHGERALFAEAAGSAGDVLVEHRLNVRSVDKEKYMINIYKSLLGR